MKKKKQNKLMVVFNKIKIKFFSQWYYRVKVKKDNWMLLSTPPHILDVRFTKDFNTGAWWFSFLVIGIGIIITYNWETVEKKKKRKVKK